MLGRVLGRGLQGAFFPQTHCELIEETLYLQSNWEKARKKMYIGLKKNNQMNSIYLLISVEQIQSLVIIF